jgi:hypothetical protein
MEQDLLPKVGNFLRHKGGVGKILEINWAQEVVRVFKREKEKYS